VAVQLSFHITFCATPSFTIGSIVKTCPAFITPLFTLFL